MDNPSRIEANSENNLTNAYKNILWCCWTKKENQNLKYHSKEVKKKLFLTAGIKVGKNLNENHKNNQTNVMFLKGSAKQKKTHDQSVATRHNRKQK